MLLLLSLFSSGGESISYLTCPFSPTNSDVKQVSPLWDYTTGVLGLTRPKKLIKWLQGQINEVARWRANASIKIHGVCGNAADPPAP
jgi:hypothetical protein